MPAFLVRRLLIAMPTAMLISLGVFLLQHLLPGDPVLAMAAEERDPAVIAFLREKHRLGDPLHLQYLAWLRNALGGDLGVSFRTNMPVLDLIGQKLPVTLQLATMSMMVAVAIGIPAGLLAAARQGTWIDHAASAVALVGLSIPNFWLGILLILVVSVQLDWLPASGYVPPTEDLGRSVETMLMPAAVLGTGLAATLARHTRSAMIGVLGMDYVRTARAMGLRERTVVLRHAFRNALTPIVTIAALLFGELMAGAVLTEQIFTIPGLGKLLVDAVFTRDYAVVQAIVLVTALGFILANLAADVACFLLNPRLRSRW